MKELWKDIKGYEGVYQVSNLGNVRSLDRIIFDRIYPKKRKGKLCKQYKANNYFFVVLYKDGKRKQHLVHRLVAEAFISNPNNYPCVNHLTPVTEDSCINSIDNLEWCDYSRNNKYAYILGRNVPNLPNKGKFGADSPFCKAIYQIDKNTDEILKKYPSMIDASKELKISATTLTQVCKKMPHRITAGGYKWRYVNE